MSHPHNTPGRATRGARIASVLGAALLVVVAAYAVGATGIPGQAVTAGIDWAAARGWVPDSPGARLAITSMSAEAARVVQ